MILSYLSMAQYKINYDTYSQFSFGNHLSRQYITHPTQVLPSSCPKLKLTKNLQSFFTILYYLIIFEATITSLASFGYSKFKFDWITAIKNASKTFISKGVFSLVYFYTFQIVNTWLQSRLQEKNSPIVASKEGDTQAYCLSDCWTSIFTSITIMPLLLGTNTVISVGQTPRQIMVRSVVDGLLLAIFSIEAQRYIKTRRKKLMNPKQWKSESGKK